MNIIQIQNNPFFASISEKLPVDTENQDKILTMEDLEFCYDILVPHLTKGKEPQIINSENVIVNEITYSRILEMQWIDENLNIKLIAINNYNIQDIKKAFEQGNNSFSTIYKLEKTN